MKTPDFDQGIDRALQPGMTVTAHRYLSRGYIHIMGREVNLQLFTSQLDTIEEAMKEARLMILSYKLTKRASEDGSEDS